MTTSKKTISTARGVRNISLQSTINALTGTGLFIFMARMITPEEMGLFSALTLTLSIGVMVGVLGLDYAATRYISYLEGKRKQSMIRATGKRILIISLISSGITTSAFFIFAPTISQLLFRTDSYTPLLQITALTIFPTISQFVVLGFLQGFQSFSMIAITRILAQITRLTATVALLLAGFGVLGAILGWAMFAVVFVIMALPLIVKNFIRKDEANTTELHPTKLGGSLGYRELFAFSLPMMGVYMLNYIVNSMDQYVVLGITGLESLGGYFVATTASSVIITILGTPLIMTLTPSFSEVHGKKNIDAVAKSLTHASRYIGLFFTPATFLLAALSPIALHILGGTSYLNASTSLTIMSLGLSTYGISVLMISTLTAIAKTRTILIVLALASITELVASITLTPLYGLTGAATSRVIMYIVMLIAFLYLGKRHIPILLDKKAFLNSLAASTVMALATYILASLTGFTIWFLPIYLLVALTTYTLCLSALKGITVSDVNLIMNMIPKGPTVYVNIKRRIKKSRKLYSIATRLISN